MRTIEQAQIKGNNIVVRVDFNVPIALSGEVEDDLKIRTSLPTIKHLLLSGAKRIILISHLGRPVMQSKERLELIISGNSGLILDKVAQKLADWLKIKGKVAKENIDSMELPAYKILDRLFLLENIRFLEGEGKNDPDLAKKLAHLGDIFINDAFAASHRAHASILGIASFIPAYAGLLLEKEVEQLSQLTKKPEHPFVLILGGAKIADKILLLKNLIKKVDFVLLGGVMANTFLKTRNIDIKKSTYEEKCLNLAQDIFDSASRKIILPTDIVWDNEKIVDIGPSTIVNYERIILRAKTIFWNGTMGLTSLGKAKYKKGTQQIAQTLAQSKGVTIVCGGDTTGEVDKIKLTDKMSYISTGGGAALEFLAGKELPGIKILE